MLCSIIYVTHFGDNDLRCLYVPVVSEAVVIILILFGKDCLLLLLQPWSKSTNE